MGKGGVEGIRVLRALKSCNSQYWMCYAYARICIQTTMISGNIVISCTEISCLCFKLSLDLSHAPFAT